MRQFPKLGVCYIHEKIIATIIITITIQKNCLVEGTEKNSKKIILAKKLQFFLINSMKAITSADNEGAKIGKRMK